ncbi:MAG: hypothetical protein RIQ96_2017 [Pseudomonadota bacterium]
MSTTTLTELPLFPLGTVLFPGGVLPLRIFEVRYLDMIGRCWKEGRPFGVVSLTQGHEVRRPDATESFAQVGTLAHITHFEAPQPGLMMIRSVGGQRFRLAESRQLKHGLWTGAAETLPDDPEVPVPEDLQPVARALGEVLTRLKAQMSAELTPEQAARAELQFPFAEPWRLDDCAWVANRWCELLPVAAVEKQRMMELGSPLMRLELVGDVVGKADGVHRVNRN